MYVCTSCGHQTDSVSTAHEYEHRRLTHNHCERCIDGVSGHCTACNGDSFFFKINSPDPTARPEERPAVPEQKSNELDDGKKTNGADDDNISSTGSELETVRHKCAFLQRLRSLNAQNWATEAVDPPAGLPPVIPPPPRRPLHHDLRKNPPAMDAYGEEQLLTYSAYRAPSPVRMPRSIYSERPRAISEQRKKRASVLFHHRRAASLAKEPMAHSSAVFDKEKGLHDRMARLKHWRGLENLAASMATRRFADFEPVPQQPRQPLVRSCIEKGVAHLGGPSFVHRNSSEMKRGHDSWERNRLNDDDDNDDDVRYQESGRYKVDDIPPTGRHKRSPTPPPKCGKQAKRKESYQYAQPRLTAKELKRLQQCYGTDDQSGPGTSNQPRGRANKELQPPHSRKAGGAVVISDQDDELNSSNSLEILSTQPSSMDELGYAVPSRLQAQLTQKQQRIMDLDDMRHRIEEEAQRTKMELYELQCQKQFEAERYRGWHRNEKVTRMPRIKALGKFAIREQEVKLRKHKEKALERTARSRERAEKSRERAGRSREQEQNSRDRERGGRSYKINKLVLPSNQVKPEDVEEDAEGRKEKLDDSLDQKLDCLMNTVKETSRPGKQDNGYNEDNRKKGTAGKWIQPERSECFEPTAPPLREVWISWGGEENEKKRLDTDSSSDAMALTISESISETSESTTIIYPSKSTTVKVGKLKVPVGRRRRNSRVCMSGAFPSYETFMKSATLPKRVGRLRSLVSNVQRAVYRGFACDPKPYVQHFKKNAVVCFGRNVPPEPQFETIQCSASELETMLQLKPHILQYDVPKPLVIGRSPINCPDGDCARLAFISDFNKHLLHDHRALTMERIGLRQTKTFFLDTRVTLLNKAKCHMLYLVRDKIYDQQSDEMRDLLPVLVMTARVNLVEAFGYGDSLQRQRKNIACETELFLIWMTSLVPSNMRITGTLSVWPTTRPEMVESLYVHTSEVYDIRGPPELPAICRSNSTLILPGEIVKRMTNNGKDFIGVQVQIY
ncbi:uncharacterized protein LOC115622424 [Scaptodrosophila lebanonensis]|uniref:Uncharacterized protein LOC115622424 n=1 Tax=Drosophila lebanonensis TaxID=7225 RepID=A0A6J2T898_DROLE|nr:uncharacterized protein LOC115622424 [Scaptodrosophila lebanonensis]